MGLISLSASLLGACSSTSTSLSDLNYAIVNDDLATVQKSISDGANVNGSNNNRKTTPLHTAVSRGNVAMVKELVEAGAEIELADCDGMTSLMYASHFGSLAVARYLIDKGANVNRRADEANITCSHFHPDDTPLSIASEYNHPDLVRLLLKKGAKAGGRRAYAYALIDPAREPIAALMKKAGYRADEDTARMVAQLSGSGNGKVKSNAESSADQQVAAAQNDSKDDEYTATDAAVDTAGTVATGVLLSVLGGF